MTPEGYPDEAELKAIAEWHYTDLFNLFNFIKLRWAYSSWGWKESWITERPIGKGQVLSFEISTAGWSGNEGIINALLSNNMVKMLTYHSWRRGGHYEFQINPVNLGYKPVKEWKKELGISRQAIYRSQEFERLNIGNKLILFKKKSEKEAYL